MMLLIILLMALLLIDAFILGLFAFNFKEYEQSAQSEMPVVSILIAVKDEEHTIARCLKSLTALSYPRSRTQILIGNDASTDDTLSIIKAYEGKYPHIHVLDITDQITGQKGKANVLAQLAKQATGDYYLITDADMALPENWLQYMLLPMKDNIDLAIGVTRVQQNSLQNLDWIYALAMIKVITDAGLPVTGMGNNMVISKKAYQSVGGYEALPFSITEDYQLFRAVKEKGYQCTHIFQKEVLGETLPIHGFVNLLNQRKRWMKGVLQLPVFITFLLSSHPIFYLGAILLLLSRPEAALILFFCKLMLRGALALSIKKRLETSLRFLSVVIYEVYGFLLIISSLIYYVLPIQISWKGRKY